MYVLCKTLRDELTSEHTQFDTHHDIFDDTFMYFIPLSPEVLFFSVAVVVVVVVVIIINDSIDLFIRIGKYFESREIIWRH